MVPSTYELICLCDIKHKLTYSFTLKERSGCFAYFVQRYVWVDDFSCACIFFISVSWVGPLSLMVASLVICSLIYAINKTFDSTLV